MAAVVASDEVIPSFFPEVDVELERSLGHMEGCTQSINEPEPTNLSVFSFLLDTCPSILLAPSGLRPLLSYRPISVRGGRDPLGSKGDIMDPGGLSAVQEHALTQFLPVDKNAALPIKRRAIGSTGEFLDELGEKEGSLSLPLPTPSYFWLDLDCPPWEILPPKNGGRAMPGERKKVRP